MEENHEYPVVSGAHDQDPAADRGRSENVDIVVEIIDARIPISSRNPDIDAIRQASPGWWCSTGRTRPTRPGTRPGGVVSGRRAGRCWRPTPKRAPGVNQFSRVVQEVLKDQIARWQEKGLVGRPVRAMVVGVPNVGKSTFINKVAKKKSAKARDRPGVTRGKQWVTVDRGLELLDTPGSCGPSLRTWRPGCAWPSPAR